MRQWKWILAAFVGMLLLPKGQGVDIGKLEPIELLCICHEEGKLKICTDGEACGTGATLEEALARMKETASKTVFLDTAAYVVLTEETEELCHALGEVLHPSAKVLLATGRVDVKRLVPYLRSRDLPVTLRQAITEKAPLPQLGMEEGRYYIE